MFRWPTVLFFGGQLPQVTGLYDVEVGGTAKPYSPFPGGKHGGGRATSKTTTVWDGPKEILHCCRCRRTLRKGQWQICAAAGCLHVLCRAGKEADNGGRLWCRHNGLPPHWFFDLEQNHSQAQETGNCDYCIGV